MTAFNPEAYGETIAALLQNVPVAPLDAGTPREEARTMLATLSVEKLGVAIGRKVRDENMANACLAGLWLRHNFMEESHVLSQEIETATGSFWHGILHRREPDYDNARYWFRRVGAHPVLPALGEAAATAGWAKMPRWDAMAFIGQVEAAMRAGPEQADYKLCRAVQQLEWELLFDFCWTQAIEKI